MSAALLSAKMHPVTTPNAPADEPDEESTGHPLEVRMKALGLNKLKLARLAQMSRGTVYQVFKGEASDAKTADLARALDEYEAHPEDRADGPAVLTSHEEGLIEIELDDVYGIGRIVVRGVDHEEAVDSVVNIIRRIRREATEDPGV